MSIDSKNQKVEDILLIADFVMKLKKLPRTGWGLHGVKDGESVADHSYGLAMLAMLIGSSLDVDQTKLIKMALLHDLAESSIGDVVTQRGDKVLENEQDKLTQEREAFVNIMSANGMGVYIDLFDEYLKNESVEAKIVHQLDKLEMAIQAGFYMNATSLDLSEFFVNAKKYVKDENLDAMLDQVINKAKI